jgi:hypothetical protein
VPIETFEKFGLDKHGYFRDFFWTSYPKQFMSTGSDSTDMLRQLVNKYTRCDQDNLLYVEKRNSITEEEFYAHLLCVLSGSDDRDRFLVNVAYMEAIYKTPSVQSTDPIAELFETISRCFADKVKLTYFLRAQAELSVLLGCKFPTCNDLDGLFPVVSGVDDLIDQLSPAIQNNCVAMEVLCRHAVRAIDYGRGCEGCDGDGSNIVRILQTSSNSEITGYATDIVGSGHLGIPDVSSEKYIELFERLLHGTDLRSDPKSVVSDLVDMLVAESTGPTTVSVLLNLIHLQLCDIISPIPI